MDAPLCSGANENMDETHVQILAFIGLIIKKHQELHLRRLVDGRQHKKEASKKMGCWRKCGKWQQTRLRW